MITMTEKPELSYKEIVVAMRLPVGSTCIEMSIELDIPTETIRSILKRLRDKTGYRRKSLLTAWADRNQRWLVKDQKRINGNN